MTVKRLVQLIHRWLGLLLGVQVLLWMASGVVMSWLSLSLVRGETTAAPSFPVELPATSYSSPGGIIVQEEGVTELHLRRFQGKPVYETVSANGRALFDAETGERISPIDETMARKVAQTDFLGDGDLVQLVLTGNPPREFQGDSPVWRAEFDDVNQTRLYISPDTGKVLARRNRIWRFYDFFWMLHIMDYGERENFNNPLLKTASVTGFLFAASGLWLVLIRIRNGRYFSDVLQRDR